MVDGVIRLLNTLHSTSAAHCFDLYTGLDRCRAEIKNNRLGHPLHCHLGEDCDSLLRPARILGCHYPYLRTLTARLYDQRRVAFAVQDVREGMSNGDFSALKEAVSTLTTLLARYGAEKAANEQQECDDEVEHCPVDEEEILSKYEKPLAEVAEMRDTYTKTACDVCD